MAKRLNDNDVMGLVGTSTVNYIKQISDGTTAHDLALTKGITFFNGKNDTSGVKWDGVQDLEVIIPTLADIVSNPVTLKGVIDDAEDIPSSASNGDLYYIGANGVTVGGQLCEAGDMAVYYDGAWHVISGENQVAIVGTADQDGNVEVLLTGTAASVLTCEGKTLKLAVDYSDVRSKTKVTKNGANTINVANGTVAVDGMSIALTYTSSASTDIATTMSIDLPTSLASGAVTIDQSVLEASNFTFNSGAFPTAVKNSASVSVDATTNISVTGTFVTSVSALGGVTLVNAAAADSDKISFATGLSAVSGTDFITNVRAYDSTKDEGKTPAFEIPGAVTVTGISTFVSGLSETEAATGDVVTSVTVGAVTVNNSGSSFLSGLSAGGNSVITGVTFGSTEKSSDQWFYDGLTDGSDVVTGVEVGAVTLVADETANAGSPAIVSASVNASHVLVFNTSNFQTPVTISQTNSTISKKGFSKAGVGLTGFSSASDTFLKAGISQANSTISYKSILTGNINVSLGSATQYFVDTAKDHAYTAEMGYAKLSLSDATVSTGSPALENTGITAYIPADAVVVSLSNGTLPTFSVGTATGTLTGSVGTTLDTSNVSWLAVNSEKRNVAGAGSYALTSDSTATGIVGSAITVAEASTYSVANATVTIASNTYVTDVFVDDAAVTVSTNA